MAGAAPIAESASDVRGWPLTAATVALVAAVAFVQLGLISRHSLRNNEFLTIRTINQPYAEILRERPRRNHMPTYFLALKAWAEAFGRSEAALRFPAALAALAGILVVWRTGVRLYGPRLGLLVLVLCGLNQIHAKTGADARPYAWAFLGAALVSWAFIAYLDTGRRRYVVGLALAGIAMLAVQTLYTFVALAVVIYAIARRRAIAPARPWAAVAAALVPFLVWLPALVHLVRVEDKIGLSHPWGRFGLYTGVRQTGTIFMGDPERGWPAVEAAGALLLAVCVAALVVPRVRGLWRRGRSAGGSEAAAAERPVRYEGFLWLLVAIPMVAIPLLGLRSHQGDPLVGPRRYFITAGAGAPLLLVAAYVALRNSGRRRLATAYAAGFCGVVVTALLGFLALPGGGVREVARHVGARLRPDDLVVAADMHTIVIAFPHYGLPRGQVIRAPKETMPPREFCDWLPTRCEAAKRVWVVVTGRHAAKSEILSEMARQAARFRPADRTFAIGRTAVRVFDLLGQRTEPGKAPRPEEPEEPAPESVPEE